MCVSFAFNNCISQANLCQIVAFDFIIILSIRRQKDLPIILLAAHKTVQIMLLLVAHKHRHE